MIYASRSAHCHSSQSTSNLSWTLLLLLQHMCCSMLNLSEIPFPNSTWNLWVTWSQINVIGKKIKVSLWLFDIFKRNMVFISLLESWTSLLADWGLQWNWQWVNLIFLFHLAPSRMLYDKYSFPYDFLKIICEKFKLNFLLFIVILSTINKGMYLCLIEDANTRKHI